MSPLLILGCIRSGTTILHELLISACPNAVDLTDDDFESRYFWQDVGLSIGSRSTGTYCCPAGRDEISEEQFVKVQDYLDDRTREGKVVITKNPHLLNKVAAVACLLPKARFILIVRDPMSVSASKKLLFQSAHIQNEDYPPFIHYWPEEKSPCWWTFLDDQARGGLTAGLLRRKAKEVCYTIGLKRRKRLTAPGKIFDHQRLSAFLREHPDLSRYYPGDGFARIPEAWLTLNANACRQLSALGGNRWLSLAYAELVANPQEAIRKVCDFAGISPTQVSAVPQQLDESRAQKWQKDLTCEEQEIVAGFMRSQGRRDFMMLCDLYNQDLLDNY